jgi:hypothetical protein
MVNELPKPKRKKRNFTELNYSIFVLSYGITTATIELHAPTGQR